MNMWDKVFERCKKEIIARISVWDETGEDVFLIAIDGMCGSGKSTVGYKLQEYFGCSLFHLDDFFLQPHQRTPERLAQPGGNVDYERFQTQILDRLNDREGLRYRPFDCSVFALGEERYVPFSRIVIMEGAYSCHPYFKNVQNMKLFLEGSKEGQLERIAKRNSPQQLKMFQERWIPMEERYFECFGIKEKCICINVDAESEA